MNIDIKKLKNCHLEDVVEMVLKNYQVERNSVPFLPFENNFKNLIRSRLKKLISEDTGVVALVNGKIIGFIAGYKINEFWGDCRGIYCPDYGHGAMGDDRKKIYQRLYRYSAGKWVEDGFTHHALTIYAHDRETIDTFFWLGFGLRCVDAMREAAAIEKNNTELSINKVGKEGVAKIADLQEKFHNYLTESPVFIPGEKEDLEKYLEGWLDNNNRHLWVADKDEEAVGFMKMEPEGERFITESEAVMNITGAYVKEGHRQSRIAASLLGDIQKWLLGNDYKLCGVDYESFNPAGSNFWNQFFTPYAYSLARRIDERVLS